MVSVVLSLSVLLTSVGAVSANNAASPTLPDPQVTPISGNTKFSVTLLPILELPGVTTLDSGMLVPTGFPAGEKQFEGKGVQISGFTYGSAKVCFAVTSVNQGWGGQVGSWNGTKWELLPTTITAQEDTSNSWACANINANGSYAFINWVVDASKLPTQGVCNFGIDYQFDYNYGYAYGNYMGLDIPASVPNGTPLTYSIIKIDPTYTGKFVSGSTGSTTVKDYFSHAAVFLKSPVVFSVKPGPVYTARFEFPTLNCYVDLAFLGYEMP